MRSVLGSAARVLSICATVVLAGLGVVVAAPVASAAACTDIDVSYARGTFEPGSLGFIVGDPIYSAVQSRLQPRSVSSYQVNYPADLNEPASIQQGNRDLVNHVTSQAAGCPRQRFVLVGYSQGANVVDNSIGISSDGVIVGGPIVATIPASIASRVAAILLFGNPIRSDGRSVTGLYESRTKDYCADGDPICQFLGTNPLAHFSYGGNAADAAEFVAGKA